MGIPTVTVATDAFTELFQLESQQRGLPELAHVLVPHPIGGIKPEAVRVKAAPLIDEILAALTHSA
jgi:hypothetical protein